MRAIQVQQRLTRSFASERVGRDRSRRVPQTLEYTVWLDAALAALGQDVKARALIDGASLEADALKVTMVTCSHC